MKYSLFYSSLTGNTERLANTVDAYLKKAGYEKAENAADADLVCVGFWAEEGTANKNVRDYLKTLKDAKVFLFGSAGFGDSQTYFNGILENAEDSLDASNEVVGTFMCRGKISEAIKNAFEKDKDIVPKQGIHYDLMMENYDKSKSHPDEADLKALEEAAGKAADAVKN